MKIDILVHQQVDIPDDRVLEVAQKVREKFEMSSHAMMHAEDLVNQAAAMGLVELPDRWDAKTEDDFSPAELEEIAKPKKAKKKSRKS